MTKLLKYDVYAKEGIKGPYGGFGGYVATVKAASAWEAALAATAQHTELNAADLDARRPLPPLKYEARFGSDGKVFTRTSASRRVYTHAWRLGRNVGFSGSLQLAQAELHKRIGSAWTDVPDSEGEIVPAVLVVRTSKKED